MAAGAGGDGDFGLDYLRVKDVAVAPAGDGDGDQGARTQRFAICHNPEQTDRDRQVRRSLVTHLQLLIDGSDTWTARRRDELVGSLKTKPGLRRTPPGCSASTTPRSSGRRTSTASGCCAPPTPP